MAGKNSEKVCKKKLIINGHILYTKGECVHRVSRKYWREKLVCGLIREKVFKKKLREIVRE